MEFDLHPDMSELVAAKRALPRSDQAGTLRDAWNDYGRSMQRPYPEGMTVHDEALPAPRPGRAAIPVRIYRPAGSAAPAPCVVYIHGGGFIKGSLESGDPVAWGVAAETGAVVISLDYRLAPEHPFPTGAEDCYAAIAHVAAHGTTLGVDPARLAVWGDSAGANLAAAVCLMARDRGGPRLVAQALNYPCLTDEFTLPAYERYAESPGLTTAGMENSWNLYLAGARPTSNPYAAPLKAANLSGLPPAHIHIAEIDPLADDGRRYAERLTEAGTPAELRCAERMIHGFLRARFVGPAAAAEFDRPCAFLRRHLA